ncbi:hypothetical protein L204_103152 [Cryptococcus depauperatus]|nr:hypothetical protein L204_00102 [Cryptococcus depauperatus CBS 7855]
MRHALRLLQETSERFIRLKAKTFTATQVAKMEESQRPKYLLLQNIPRTAIPRDILRALKDGKAVDPSFPISSITSPPPSLPRTPSMYRTWHLTLPSHVEAASIYSHLNRNPLFSASRYYLPTFRSSARTESVNKPDAPAGSSVRFTTSSSADWVTGIMESAKQTADARAAERDRGFDTGFTPEWVMQPLASGRRVVIRGLPGGIIYEDVKRLTKGITLVDGPDSCKRLPASKFSLVSTFCISTQSVAEAYRLVRKVHMKWYKSSKFGEKYLMRAEVAY